MINTKAIYFKVNRENGYVIPNLKHWIEAAELYEGMDIYILCDNANLKEKIICHNICDEKKTNFLESYRDCEAINTILKNVCAIDKWVKVGQAHLTTFWHANQKHYKYFWNIDADDTFIYLDPVRIVEMFQTVEHYSIKNNIAMNGLDMWRSMSVAEKWWKGDNWSLGVTFTDNHIQWESVLLEHCQDKEFQKNIFEGDKEANLDWYFTYLKKIEIGAIETFYFENMKFAHFYDYFLDYPHMSSISYWKNGKIHYPILEECFTVNYMGAIEIAKDILKFDIGITDDESMVALLASSQEKSIFMKELRNSELKIDHVMRRRCDMFLEKKGKKNLVFWGAGNAFVKNYELIAKACNLKYVCDNDSKKWGSTIKDDVVCISPQELKNMDDVFIVVLVENIAANYQIIHQLIDMGITEFEHFENWINEVEGVRKL